MYKSNPNDDTYVLLHFVDFIVRSRVDEVVVKLGKHFFSGDHYHLSRIRVQEDSNDDLEQ